jgi:hypothetical protein
MLGTGPITSPSLSYRLTPILEEISQDVGVTNGISHLFVITLVWCKTALEN